MSLEAAMLDYVTQYRAGARWKRETIFESQDNKFENGECHDAYLALLAILCNYLNIR